MKHFQVLGNNKIKNKKQQKKPINCKIGKFHDMKGFRPQYMSCEMLPTARIKG